VYEFEPITAKDRPQPNSVRSLLGMASSSIMLMTDYQINTVAYYVSLASAADRFYRRLQQDIEDGDK